MASKQGVYNKTGSSTQSETVPSISLVPRSYWCETKAAVDEVNFKWTIERFAFFDSVEKREYFISTEFDNKFRLSLHVYYQYIEINLLSSTILRYPIRVEVAFINKNNEEMGQQENVIPANTLFPVSVFVETRSTLRSENIEKEEITISCKIESLTSKIQLTGKATGTERYLDETLISDNNQDLILNQLEEMFEKMSLSDVTFNIQGRKFEAHKNILAMRSPVFKAMFHHQTKEVLSNQVDIEDIDPDVFQEVLRFIYTGKTQSTAMNEMTLGILVAADKYLLEDLKIRCETHLIRQMSAENCLELLSLATHHPAEHLKKYAIEYFRQYPDDVVKTDTWKKMKEENLAALFNLQQMFLTAPTI